MRKNKLIQFEYKLIQEEKSQNTIDKYIRDIKHFLDFLGTEKITKEILIKYKNSLINNYEITSVNSMLSSINSYLEFLECNFKIKQLKIQKQIFCDEEKELTKAEYQRLVRTAYNNKNERLAMILQTICATGIRISELQYITLENVQKGVAKVNCKGKIREIFIVRELQKKLIKYARKYNIKSGEIFITKTGKSMSRSNIWREMKALCEQADVNPSKVFPHNLRHLFARVFYKLEKDIAKLADILGHSNINTTRIYIVSTGAEHRKWMELMRLVV